MNLNDSGKKRMEMLSRLAIAPGTRIHTIVVQKIISESGAYGNNPPTAKEVLDSNGGTHRLSVLDFSLTEWNEIGPGSRIEITLEEMPVGIRVL